jgi:hypothetical protein
MTFNAVIEMEVPFSSEVELTYDDVAEMMDNINDLERKTGKMNIDEITPEVMPELHSLFLGFVPEELKKHCISMTFNNVNATPVQRGERLTKL